MLVHLNIFNVRVKDVPIPARYGQEKPHDEGAPTGSSVSEATLSKTRE